MDFLPLLSRRSDLSPKVLYSTCVGVIFPVCLVSAETVYKGLYADDAYYTGPSSNWTMPFNLTPDGAPIQTNLEGERVTQNAARTTFAGERSAAKRLIVKVLFLKDKAELEKFLSKRKEYLDKLIQSPAPAAAKESAPEKK